LKSPIKDEKPAIFESFMDKRNLLKAKPSSPEKRKDIQEDLDNSTEYKLSHVQNLGNKQCTPAKQVNYP